MRVSFFFSSDSRAWWDSGWDCARGIFPPRECFPGPPLIIRTVDQKMGVMGCGKLDLGVSAAKTTIERVRVWGFSFLFLISLISH